MRDDPTVTFRIWWLLWAAVGLSMAILAVWAVRWILGALVRMAHSV